jgi:integration host factor subunit beta
MTKSELINILSNKQKHLSNADVEIAVNVILKCIEDALAKGGRVEIRDFGSFSLRFRAARIGRNPKTGEAVAIEKTHLVHFKMGADLKKRVDESSSQYPIKKL